MLMSNWYQLYFNLLSHAKIFSELLVFKKRREDLSE